MKRPFMVALFVLAGCGLLIIGTERTIRQQWRFARRQVPSSMFTDQTTIRRLINGKPMVLEIAASDASWARGLSGRLSMPLDHGMLFVFPRQEIRSFWMQNMRFPIDMVWMQGERIVDIAPNMPSSASDSEEPAVYSPGIPVDRVLELNAGQANALGLQKGTVIRLRP